MNKIIQWNWIHLASRDIVGGACRGGCSGACSGACAGVCDGACAGACGRVSVLMRDSIPCSEYTPNTTRNSHHIHV